MNQQKSNGLRYSDPGQVEEWRRSGVQEVGSFLLSLILMFTTVGA